MSAAKPQSPTTSVTAGLRRFLYLTAALNGGAILVVEILGAKMLSPYFGTSHFVWTAQIAVTLVSLAVGYWFGGRLADRAPDLRRLYWCMLIAAVYLAATVPLVKTVSFAALNLKLATGSIVAAVFLFFVPLTLLAVTGPFLSRMLIRSTAESGGVVGRISAVSTFGSVGGTLLIAYVLIPLLPYSITMLATAGLIGLLAIGCLVWGTPGRGTVAPSVAAVSILLAIIAGSANVGGGSLPGYREIARANSDFGLLQVLESDGGDRRYYLNDLLVQNTYDPVSRQSVSLFTHMLHGLAEAYAPRVENVLCIGMGVGIVPGQFARAGRRVDVVEINPAVVPLAQEHFDLDLGAIQLTIGDGRQHVHTLPDGQYDAVVLDAFLGDSSPAHLMTREAFTDLRRVLRPAGVLVINAFARFEPGRDFMAASLDKTLKEVFQSVIIHASGNGNVFYVASEQETLKMWREPELEAVHPAVRGEMLTALAGIMRPAESSGIVLTDDFNPVEYRDAANRERFRRDLTRAMLAR